MSQDKYTVTINGKKVSGARFVAGYAQSVWYDRDAPAVWGYEDAARIKNGFPHAKVRKAA